MLGHVTNHLGQLSLLSRIDYCNVLLAGAPKATTDKLQWLLNAAARLLSGTKKFDRGLSQVMHVDLHWLDVPEGSG